MKWIVAMILVALFGATFVTTPARASDLEPIYRIKTQDPVAFITVDDGWRKSTKVRDLIENKRVPITTFITTDAIQDRERFFRRVSQWGSIQNHSVTHARFGRSSTNLRREICGAQSAIQRRFGTRPWMMRPPYGDAAHSKRVSQVARSCGITHIVMWDAAVWLGKVTYRNKGLRPGSIILLHFNSGLDEDLKIALRLIERAGLRPANLDDYLPAPQPMSDRLNSPSNPLRQ